MPNATRDGRRPWTVSPGARAEHAWGCAVSRCYPRRAVVRRTVSAGRIVAEMLACGHAARLDRDQRKAFTRSRYCRACPRVRDAPPAPHATERGYALARDNA